MSYIKCVLSVLLGLLLTGLNIVVAVTLMLNFIIAIFTTGYLTLIQTIKSLIERLFGTEFPWWLPFDPRVALMPAVKSLKESIKGFGKIWKRVRRVCNNQ